MESSSAKGAVIGEHPVVPREEETGEGCQKEFLVCKGRGKETEDVLRIGRESTTS